MLIEETPPTGSLTIDTYTPREIVINGHSYHEPIILKDNHIETAPNLRPEDLKAQNIFQIIGEDTPPELILVGTGEKHIFLHPQTTAEVLSIAIGLECMNTSSACRTYTLLKSEDRRIWCWLWP